MPTRKKPTKNRRSKKWSTKYKKSINCNKPKGFSQKQYCKYGRKKSYRKSSKKKSRRKSSKKKSRRKSSKKKSRRKSGKRRTASMTTPPSQESEDFEYLDQLEFESAETDAAESSKPSAAADDLTALMQGISIFESPNTNTTKMSEDLDKIQTTIETVAEQAFTARAQEQKLNELLDEEMEGTQITISTIVKHIKMIKDAMESWENVKKLAMSLDNGNAPSSVKGAASASNQDATSHVNNCKQSLDKLEKLLAEKKKRIRELKRTKSKNGSNTSSSRRRKAPKSREARTTKRLSRSEQRALENKARRNKDIDKKRMQMSALKYMDDNAAAAEDTATSRIVEDELANLMGAFGGTSGSNSFSIGMNSTRRPVRAAAAAVNIDRALNRTYADVKKMKRNAARESAMETEAADQDSQMELEDLLSVKDDMNDTVSDINENLGKK
jgi:hypothetical protein